jgi:hypothetical protein
MTSIAVDKGKTLTKRGHSIAAPAIIEDNFGRNQ